MTGQTTIPADPQHIPEDCWEVEPEAASVAEARRRAVAAARVWCPEPLPDDYADTIRRVISELVTNAVRHAGTAGPITVSLCPTRKGNLIVAVTDSSPTPPTPRGPYNDGTSGYGLAVVAAEAITWRWKPEGKGKVVSATIALPHSKTRPRKSGTATAERGPVAPTRQPGMPAPIRQAVESAA
ncbi:ATP-binding protein [Kitasatospora sp. NPDC056184]|uniref:ATP-binding protein n=1 Tax=Kitasatospora sp. NPDC056184 TaxID=3345738 RepID=UPI0035DAA24D